MNYERMWERLIAALDDWTAACEVQPGRIEVTLPDTGSDSRVIQIVMTPDEWDTMAGTVFGGFQFAFDYVMETLAAWDASYPYAVFSTYDLVASETPELPMDSQLERLQELAREHPEGIGGWFTYDGERMRQEFRHDES